MMRYLQFDTLEENGHRHFDSWAATFGEKVTAMELKPEGTGFRSKTRFAKFYNLPELISIWKEAADIQTADMLNLPTPEAEYITVTTEPSVFQEEMVAELGARAEDVRSGGVDPSEDNMLRITSDGRKLALDQRLQNPLLPDDPDSKVNACVKNIFREWQDSAEIRGTQLVFCDLSTPKGDGKFNVYDDIKDKLIERGIPQEEIAFMKQNLTYTAELADDAVGNVTRINNALEGMADKLQAHEARLVTLEKELQNAQEESERPFPKDDELREKSARLNQLNRELEKPNHKAAEQSHEDATGDLEDGEAPAPEPPALTIVGGGKPSIRAAIRAYNPPAPVSPGVEKSQRREAAL